MSAFNVVQATVRCPVCGNEGGFSIQFKYGNTWQYTYSIGDSLRWGGNDIGRPGARRVVVEGIGGPCPHCGSDGLEFDVAVNLDRLVAVTPLLEERQTHSSEGFTVLEQ